MASQLLTRGVAVSEPPAIIRLLISSYSKSDAGFALYNLEVIYKNGARYLMRKRYSEFLSLHESLKKIAPEVNSFSFPTRTMG
jgi:hypothetical protein